MSQERTDDDGSTHESDGTGDEVYAQDGSDGGEESTRRPRLYRRAKGDKKSTKPGSPARTKRKTPAKHKRLAPPKPAPSEEPPSPGTAMRRSPTTRRRQTRARA